MSKWINFGSIMVKKKDIDYLQRDWEQLTILCHYHQGMNYLFETEKWSSEDAMITRQQRLNLELGIWKEES